MKKMTKIESARIVFEQNGDCVDPITIGCDKCFNEKYCSDERAKAEAESYIKRHEQKSRKKKVKETVKSNVKGDEHIVPKPEPCEHLINGDSCGSPFDYCDKDCPANSEYPDPIRVDIPDIFYCPTPQGILRFKRSQIILKETNNEDCLLKLHDEYPCYRTLEEAVIVAKKMWGV